MRSLLRGGYVLLAVLSMVALAATGYGYLTLDEVRSRIPTTPALKDVPNTPPDDGAEDILLVGADNRTDAKGNPLPLRVLKQLRTTPKSGVHTDTIIILRMPRDGARAKAISIPRDSWVDVPSGGQSKINSAFGSAKVAETQRLLDRGGKTRAQVELASDQAGRKALVQTVQDFTKVRVDHYAEVSLLGFYLLTEALGGVEVCLNQATSDKDSGADFPAGRQVISGGEALAYVRQRKNLPHGDLDRIVRQQTFLGSALHKVLSADTLTSPRKLEKLVSAIERSVVLDPDLDIVEFARQARGMASGDVQFVTIPVVNINGRSDDGQSIVVVDKAAVRKYIAGLLPKPNAPGGGNTTASSHQAAAVDSGRPAEAAAQQDDEPIKGGRAPCVN